MPPHLDNVVQVTDYNPVYSSKSGPEINVFKAHQKSLPCSLKVMKLPKIPKNTQDPDFEKTVYQSIYFNLHKLNVNCPDRVFDHSNAVSLFYLSNYSMCGTIENGFIFRKYI